ncbi:MAG: hypothetical protein KJZ53_03705 [Anaerolineales bacterium]|nr:hypothetical protein [Anaerolineales bacterium]
MPEVLDFEGIDKQVLQIRGLFRGAKLEEMGDLTLAISTFLAFVQFSKQATNRYNLEDERFESFLGLVVKAFHMVLGVLYMSESGLYNLVGPLVRNYSELVTLAVSVGFDDQIYIDWKNRRDTVNTFAKLRQRSNASGSVPEEYKKGLLLLAFQYWIKASDESAHQLNPKVLDGVLSMPVVEFGIMQADVAWQRKRVNLLIALCLNLCTLMQDVGDYSKPWGGPKRDDHPFKVYVSLLHKYQSNEEIA